MILSLMPHPGSTLVQEVQEETVPALKLKFDFDYSIQELSKNDPTSAFSANGTILMLRRGSWITDIMNENVVWDEVWSNCAVC